MRHIFVLKKKSKFFFRGNFSPKKGKKVYFSGGGLPPKFGGRFDRLRALYSMFNWIELFKL